MRRRDFFKSLALTVAAFSLPVSLVESATIRHSSAREVKSVKFRWKWWRMDEDVMQLEDSMGFVVTEVTYDPALTGVIIGPIKPEVGDMTIPTDLLKCQWVIASVEENYEFFRIHEHADGWKVKAYPLLNAINP